MCRSSRDKCWKVCSHVHMLMNSNEHNHESSISFNYSGKHPLFPEGPCYFRSHHPMWWLTSRHSSLFFSGRSIITIQFFFLFLVILFMRLNALLDQRLGTFHSFICKWCLEHEYLKILFKELIQPETLSWIPLL